MKRLPLLAAAVALLVSGCSAAEQNLPTTGTSARAPMADHHHPSRKGKIVLRIKIPKKRHHHRHPIGHRFVSPATQSMTVAITGASALSETVNLTPTSNGCTSTLASTLCQLSIALAPGSYTATITTYDGLNGTGNALSTAQSIAFTVVAGSSNAIAITLSGIPAQIVVLPDSATSSNAGNGFINLLGFGASKLMVEALDADGNVILGPGAPSFTVKRGTGFGTTITGPTGYGNTFTVKPTGTAYSSGRSTLIVTATYGSSVTNACTQTGAVCTGYASLHMQQLLAVLGGGSVAIFGAASGATGGGNTTPLQTISGLSSPTAIAFDLFGNLYVAQSSGVAIYAPPYISSSGSITSGVSSPTALAADTNGTLYVANGGANTVTKYATPKPASTPTVSIANGVNGPVALALDSSNNLFVANSTGSSVTEYASSYTSGSPTATITSSVTAPNAIGLDSGGDLFVSNTIANCTSINTLTIEEYGRPYGAPTRNFGTTNVNCPASLAIDRNNGRVYVGNLGSLNDVAQFRISGTHIANLPDADPTALAVDGVSNLYGANGAANTVLYFAFAYSSSSGGGLLQTLTGLTSPTAMAVLP